MTADPARAAATAIVTGDDAPIAFNGYEEAGQFMFHTLVCHNMVFAKRCSVVSFAEWSWPLGFASMGCACSLSPSLSLVVFVKHKERSIPQLARECNVGCWAVVG